MDKIYLTKREKEVLACLASRLSNKEIAEKFTLSLSSVKWYIRQIMNKLGADNRRQAVEVAMRMGVVGPSEQPQPAALRKAEREVPNNLPAQLTSFIGREADIRKGVELVKAHRMVTLTGSGGVGKTRLALRVAEQLQPVIPDGVWLVELAPIAEAGLVASTAVQALRLREFPGVTALETLCNHLKNKRALLILDNCEHLLQDCASLTDTLLKYCSRLHVLATSREILNVPGELTFRVPSLPAPNPKNPLPYEQLVQSESVCLFAERAAQVVPGFVLNEASARAAATICHRLDGIPLAIELAAARVRVLPVEQIAARLDKVFLLLMGGARTVMPRHQTLKAAIDWSYALLGPQEQAVLQRLAVFSGGCTFEAAEAVCAGEGIGVEEILGLLTGLVDKSLVFVTYENEPRYHMLETIRQYARDRLVEGGGLELICGRHFYYYQKFCEQAEPFLRGEHQARWLDRLESELNNLRLALEWSLTGHIEEGLRLATALRMFWSTRSHDYEGGQWLEKLLVLQAQEQKNQPTGPGPQNEVHLLVRMRSVTAFVSLITDQPARFNIHPWLDILVESVTLCRKMGDTASRELVEALKQISVYIWPEDIRQSSCLLEEALEICRQKLYRLEEAEVLGSLAFNDFFTGEFDKGRARIEASVAYYRAIGDRDGAAGRLGILGLYLGFQGDREGALVVFKESLAYYQEIQNDAGMHWYCIWLLNFSQDRELVSRAERAVAYFQDQDDLSPLYFAFATLIYAHWSNGDYDQAERVGHAAIAVVPRQPPTSNWLLRNYGFLFLWLGRLAITRGDPCKGRTYIETAAAWFRKKSDDYAYDWSIFLDSLAVLLAAEGDPARAVQVFAAGDTIYRHFAPGIMPRQRCEHEEILRCARQACGENGFSTAWQAGHCMTPEQAAKMMEP
jgi:predicted ATPase/DNA-binding CsgD family transcriptional regulator